LYLREPCKESAVVTSNASRLVCVAEIVEQPVDSDRDWDR
jgi:hypothetical protein